MKRHIHLAERNWFAVLVVAVLGLHFLVRHFLSHTVLSTAVVSAIVLLLATHLGAFAALLRAVGPAFRRRGPQGQ